MAQLEAVEVDGRLTLTKSRLWQALGVAWQVIFLALWYSFLLPVAYWIATMAQAYARAAADAGQPLSPLLSNVDFMMRPPVWLSDVNALAQAALDVVGALLGWRGTVAQTVAVGGLVLLLLLLGPLASLPALLRNIWIALFGEVWTFDRLSGDLLRNGQPVAALRDITHVAVEKSGTVNNGRSYHLRLALGGRRTIYLAGSGSGSTIEHLATQVSDYLRQAGITLTPPAPQGWTIGRTVSVATFITVCSWFAWSFIRDVGGW